MLRNWKEVSCIPVNLSGYFQRVGTSFEFLPSISYIYIYIYIYTIKQNAFFSNCYSLLGNNLLSYFRLYYHLRQIFFWPASSDMTVSYVFHRLSLDISRRRRQEFRKGNMEGKKGQ